MLTFSADAQAEEWLQVVRRAPSLELVDEATVRLMAELGTLGFSVERCDSEVGGCQRTDAVGRIELQASGEAIQLSARAGPDGVPVQQSIDLASYEVSAEVVAVRAAELLRAALLGALHAGELTPVEGGAVARFAVWHAPKEEPLPEPEPALPVTEQESGASSREEEASESALDWSLAVGPALHLASTQISPGLGFEVASDVAFGSAYFGASVGYQPWLMSQDSAEGTVSVRTLELHVRVGWAAPCGDTWMCHAGLFVGMHQYAFRPSPEAGKISIDAAHTSPALGGDVLFSRSWPSGFGLFTHAAVGGLLDAPQLSGEPAVLLGRPSLGFSSGLSFRLR